MVKVHFQFSSILGVKAVKMACFLLGHFVLKTNVLNYCIVSLFKLHIISMLRNGVSSFKTWKN